MINNFNKKLKSDLDFKFENTLFYLMEKGEIAIVFINNERRYGIHPLNMVN
jgi:hypothetical protein